MNSADYFDYHPQVIPAQPIAIAGFPGARNALVGATVSALTGLPLRDLEHLVEHRAGESISSIVLSQGQARLRRLEHDTLGSVLGESPPGIVVLSEGSLSKRETLQLVKRHAQLVYLRLSLFELFSHLRRELANSPGKYFYLFPQGIEHPNDLKSLHALRTAALQQAHVTLDVSNQHPTTIARRIIKLFELDNVGTPGATPRDPSTE